MENRALARRYAKVLEGLDPWGELEEAVHLLNSSIHQTHHVLMVFLDPMVPGQVKLQALRKAYGDMPDRLLEYLEFVNRKQRLDHLPLILTMYLQARHHATGVVYGQVHSATVLNPEQLTQLEHSMASHLGKRCIFTSAIDSRLLGGFTVQIGDTFYDNSVRGQLDRLRTHFSTSVG
jgi:F-type H+-transporting ATPase subunit delta